MAIVSPACDSNQRSHYRAAKYHRTARHSPAACGQRSAANSRHCGIIRRRTRQGGNRRTGRRCGKRHHAAVHGKTSGSTGHPGADDRRQIFRGGNRQTLNFIDVVLRYFQTKIFMPILSHTRQQIVGNRFKFIEIFTDLQFFFTQLSQFFRRCFIRQIKALFMLIKATLRAI